MLLNLDKPESETYFGGIKTPGKPCISERFAGNLLAQVIVVQESLNNQLLKGESSTAQSLLRETFSPD